MARWGGSGRPRTDAHQLGQHAHPIRKTQTVQHALSDRRWVRDITGALSVAVIIEYLHLWDSLENVHLQPERDDALRWRWTPDGRYSAKSAYFSLHQGLPAYDGAHLIWKSWALLVKIKLTILRNKIHQDLLVHRRSHLAY
jgi:hypothetical protein